MCAKKVMVPPVAAKSRICFERIVPDEVDPERLVRRAMRAEMTKDIDKELNPDEFATTTRMALVISKKWENGSTLNCRFLDGSAKMQKAVEAAAHQWEKFANVKFKFVKAGPAEIRISFYADAGSWSAVGRDALNKEYFPLHQPTMNFGWVRDDSTKTEIESVVLHEFGHALGCVHEHQSPEFGRAWNREKVMEYFQGSPNFWDPASIEHNVLKKYPTKGLSASRFDPKSIMLYWFDAELFTDKKGPTNENDTLSPTDKQMIAKMYPR